MVPSDPCSHSQGLTSLVVSGDEDCGTKTRALKFSNGVDVKRKLSCSSSPCSVASSSRGRG